MFVSGSRYGILYGIPKFHKTDFATKSQFWPIFAAYNSVSFQIAKSLVPVLTRVTTNAYAVAN